MGLDLDLDEKLVCNEVGHRLLDVTIYNSVAFFRLEMREGRIW